MKNNKFNIKFRRMLSASLGALCCSSLVSEAKVDIDLQNIMSDFKLSETDPNRFEDIVKQKTDNLLNLGIIEIDPSFEKVNDKSKFIIISALKKLSEIPLIKKALTHDNTKVKLVGLGIIDLESPAMYTYGYNKLEFVNNYYEREKEDVSLSKTRNNEEEFIGKINEGKVLNYKDGKPNEKIESHVSNRMLYGIKNLRNEENYVMSALNTVVHEVGHAIAQYSMYELINSKNAIEKCKKLIKATGTTPLINGEYYDGKNFNERVEKLFQEYKTNTKNPYEEDVFSIPAWLSSRAFYKAEGRYISKRAENDNQEYLAELFVHLCGFNLPISLHAVHYAKVLKVIHGENCLGSTVKY